MKLWSEFAQLAVCSALFSGCGEPNAGIPPNSRDTQVKEPIEKTPTIILAVNEDGGPQFDYTGPGSLNSYSRLNETFEWTIAASAAGQPWIKGTGKIEMPTTNRATLTLQSNSDRPFFFKLLGISTNSDPNISEERATETLPVAKGEQKLNIDRFVSWTYTFERRLH